MKRFSLFWLFLVFVFVGCDGSGNVDAPSPEPTVALSTETAVPPDTPIAEETAVLTNTPLPALPTPTPDPFYQGTNNAPWWNDTVFYELFVRSFYDSDGDGVGDINGLIEKLDYINDGDPHTTTDLGATGIWLMPIMVSPSYHGYDVVDYFQVDPEYGTNDDFQQLMAAAHARGIHVIVDLVLNHTSSEHPWFIESQNPDAEKRDWYIWEDENPGYRGPDGQTVWHTKGNGFYYGVFWSEMPDLNYANPDVTAAMLDAARFWLAEMGVDGFRLDAIKHIVEDGRAQENTAGTHAWLEQFYSFTKEVNPQALTVGEAWTSTQQVVEYTGDEVDIAFQFDLALDILNAADAGAASIFTKTQIEVVNHFPTNQYATFITNHDQNRVMSQLDEDEAKARLAASILLTGTGVPFVYYGEEIGMTGTKPDEDIRRPMQWAGESARVGFTTGLPWRAPAADYPDRNVALQDEDLQSLLNHYRTLIRLRDEHESLRVGEWTQVETNSGRLYSFLRYTDNETILVIINLNRNPVTAAKYSLEITKSNLSGQEQAISLYGETVTDAPEINDAGGFANYVPLSEIPPQSTTIIQLSP